MSDGFDILEQMNRIAVPSRRTGKRKRNENPNNWKKTEDLIEKRCAEIETMKEAIGCAQFGLQKIKEERERRNIKDGESLADLLDKNGFEIEKHNKITLRKPEDSAFAKFVKTEVFPQKRLWFTFYPSRMNKEGRLVHLAFHMIKANDRLAEEVRQLRPYRYDDFLQFNLRKLLDCVEQAWAEQENAH